MLPRTFRRLASSAISAQHKSIVDDFLHKAKKAPPIIKTQTLDQTQIQSLSLTLNRPRLRRGAQSLEEEAPRIGTPLPPGYHLVYFTPAALQHHLGKDGTDISYSPAEPFTRRMWAGGEIKWEKENPLRVGEDAVEITNLISAEPKVTRTGEAMVVVGVEKIFENAKGLALVDRRDWVFRTELSRLSPPQDYSASSARDENLLPLPDKSQKSRDYLQTAVSLFRFSALTFNAHKIHYSQPWCRAVEGHRDIVVHGPLNLINMLDFWRDEQADDSTLPRSITYRATAPFYAGETYRALLERGDRSTSVRLWGHDGKGAVRVGMLGDVVD